MEILVTKSGGFCFGVKRAINVATECAEKEKEEIYTVGPLIHNPQVVKRLERSKIIPKNNIDDIDRGTVIIRSHGITLKDSSDIQEKGLNMVDATCPFVKKSQEIVELLCKEGYFVIVVGNKEHPEVKGILSYGGVDIVAVASTEELEYVPLGKKIGIVAQTTQPLKSLRSIVNYCLERTNELRVFNTICNATTIRQGESTDLAREVECVIVVGGKNSANTNRLVELCKAIQPRTYHVEVASDLDKRWFDGIEKVGVTAGASTPDWLIKEVVSFMKGI